MKKQQPTLLTRLANRLAEIDGKTETVIQLAKIFNCPYTSLYIPIRTLEDIGFLKLKKGVIFYGDVVTKLHKELKSSEIF